MEKTLIAPIFNENEIRQISNGELYVWKVNLKDPPKKLEYFKDVLSEKELARLAFFKFDAARESYIISQGTLRILLSEYLSIEPNRLEIGRREKGKPYSMNDPDLNFNISNSGDWAVFAFSRAGEVGIDIEQVRNLPDLDEMIKSNFTNNEIRYINSKPMERANRFFRFWTIKESYLKAIGEGMRLEPQNIEFTIEQGRIRQLSVKGVFEQEDWNFREFSPGQDYVGTLTCVSENVNVMQMEFRK